MELPAKRKVFDVDGRPMSVCLSVKTEQLRSVHPLHVSHHCVPFTAAAAGDGDIDHIDQLLIMYDRNGDGTYSQEEVRDIVVELYLARHRRPRSRPALAQWLSSTLPPPARLACRSEADQVNKLLRDFGAGSANYGFFFNALSGICCLCFYRPLQKIVYDVYRTFPFIPLFCLVNACVFAYGPSAPVTPGRGQ